MLSDATDATRRCCASEEPWGGADTEHARLGACTSDPACCRLPWFATMLLDAGPRLPSLPPPPPASVASLLTTELPRLKVMDPDAVVCWAMPCKHHQGSRI